MSVPGVYNLEASLAAARQEAEPVVEEPPVTRRAVLRAAGAAAAGFILGTGTEEYTDGLPSQLLFSPDTESLPTGMPPELQGKNIDRTNEHYQPDFSKVVEAGVDAYKANGGKPFYKRPDFYISEWDAVKEKIHGYFGSSNGLAVQRDNNTPYQRFMNFSINRERCGHHGRLPAELPRRAYPY